MELKDAILQRRSVRSYTDAPISPETIEALVELAVKAPTGSGLQPWGFALLQDKAEIDALSEQIKKKVCENIAAYPEFAQYESWLKNEKYSIFNHAGTVLAVYGDTASPWCVYDCSLVAGNLMLLAEEQGIGTCWIGFAEALFDDPEFKQAHKVPANFKLVATLSMGFRKHETKPCERKAPVFFCK